MYPTVQHIESKIPKQAKLALKAPFFTCYLPIYYSTCKSTGKIPRQGLHGVIDFPK